MEVHSHVGGTVVALNPCSHGNMEVDGVGCIHHSSEKLVSSVAVLLKQLLQHQFYQQLYYQRSDAHGDALWSHPCCLESCIEQTHSH